MVDDSCIHTALRVYVPMVDDSCSHTALRVGRAQQVSAWARLYQEHRVHAGFSTTQDVLRREIGIMCTCSGEPRTWSIPLTGLREQIPEVWALLMRRIAVDARRGDKARKRLRRRADARAKALLHRWLTKEQRLSLRASQEFEVIASDGSRHRIRYGMAGNIVEVDPDGRPLYRHCLVPAAEKIPIYDLMLAQKVMLETDAGAFRKLAKTTRFQGERHHRPAVAPLGQVLVRINIPDGAFPRYAPSTGKPSFVFDGAHVTPVFEASFDVPLVADDLPDEDCILRLLTGCPARTYSTAAGVLRHFAENDLELRVLLLNPTTVDHDQMDLLGGATTLVIDERIPPGKVYCLAEDMYVGAVVLWRGRRGYCLSNLDGVAVYDPTQETLACGA